GNPWRHVRPGKTHYSRHALTMNARGSTGGAEAIEKGHELRLSQPLTEMHLAQTQFSVNSGLGSGIR
ncbi:MAG: hypothetical protein ACPIOQ_65545, partial [Promethearchaeia archaeon]